MPEWAWPSSGIVYLIFIFLCYKILKVTVTQQDEQVGIVYYLALLATSQQQQLKNLMRFTIPC